MSPAATGGTRPARDGRARVMTWLSVVVGVAVLVLGGVLVAGRWDEVSAAMSRIGWQAAVWATVLTTSGVVATAESWRVWLASLGGRPAPWTAHRVFYVTQSGKYVPGSLWPVLAQAALARRYGVSRSAMVLASTLFLLLHVVTGVLVGVVGVGLAAAARWGWLVAPVAVVGLLVLAPPVLSRLLRTLSAWRPALATAAPGWAATGRAGALMMLAWACYGIATWLLLRPLGPVVPGASSEGTSPEVVGLAVGGYALAWVVGFLVVVAPAGVGAREAVVVAVLGPVVGVSEALSVALVSRVALTVADLGLAAVSAGVLRHDLRPGVSRPGRPPSTVVP